MATSDKTYRKTVGLDFESKTVKPLLTDVEGLAKLFDALPAKVKNSTGPLQELYKSLADGISSYRTELEKAPKSKNLINFLKGKEGDSKGLLKILKDVRSAYEELEKAGAPPDFTKAINQMEALLKAAERAGTATRRNAEVKGGTFGLNATTVKDAEAALKTLQSRLTAAQHQIDSLGISLDRRRTSVPEIRNYVDTERQIGRVTAHRDDLVNTLKQEAEDERLARKDEATKRRQNRASSRAESKRLAKEETDKEAEDERLALIDARRKKAQNLRYSRAESKKLAKEETDEEKARATLDKGLIKDQDKQANLDGLARENKRIADYQAKYSRVMGERMRRQAFRNLRDSGQGADNLRDDQFFGQYQGRQDQGLLADRVADFKYAGATAELERIAKYKRRFAEVMGERNARLAARATRDSGQGADNLRDAQFLGQYNAGSLDGGVVGARNTAAYRRGEGFDPTVAKAARANQKDTMDFLGISKQMLDSSVSVRGLLKEAQDVRTALQNELIRTKNVESDLSKRLTGQLEGYRKNIVGMKQEENRKSPQELDNQEGAKASNMLLRTRGQGGAALMAVQASLIANYSILQGAINGIQSAISTSVQLEAAFRNVQAVTATTGTEMRGLEERIKSVAATSKFSSIEVAGAALILGQAGMSSKEVGVALESVVRLAAAAGTDLAQAVELVTSVVGVFDKSVSDTADIANKITQAANSSKVSVEKLSLGLQYAGNIAAQSGVSFEETTAAMAAMSNMGIKSGSTMGTGLRQFLVEVQKPSAEFMNTLRQLGLNMQDVDLKSNGLIGVVTKLRAAGFTASEAIKSFDVRGAAAFNALVADPEALQHQYNMLLNTNAAVAANEIQMDSLQAQSKRLTTSLGNLASTGLAPLSDAAKVVAGGFATIFQSMSQYPLMATAITTTVGGFIGLGLAKHFLDISIGGLKLLGVQGGLLTMFTGLQAATVGSTLGLTAVAAAETAAGTAAAAAVVPVGLLGRAMAALAGMSLLTGIGLALVAVSGAFMGVNYVLDASKRKIDELKASSNDAKAALEEKANTVKSLTEKIADLQRKEHTLTEGSDALKTAAMEVNSQFGHLTGHVDELNPKFAELISKLKGTKKEFEDLYTLQLKVKAVKDQELLGVQMKDFKAAQATLAGQAGLIPLPESVTASGSVRKLLTGLSAETRSKLSSGSLEEMGRAAGVMRNTNATPAEAGLAAHNLELIMGSMEGLSKSEQTLVGEIKRSLHPYQTTAAAAAITVGEMSANGMALTKDSDRRNFRSAPSFGGKTFDEAVEATGFQGAGRGLNSKDFPDPLALYDAKIKAMRTSAGGVEAMMSQLKSSGASESGAGKDAYSELAGVLRVLVDRAASETKAIEPLRKERLAKQLAEVGLANKGNPSIFGTAARNKSIEARNAELHENYNNEGFVTTDQVAEAKNATRGAQADAKIAKLDADAARKVNDKTIRTKEETLMEEAAKLDSQAKDIKMSAANETDMASMSKLLDEMISKMWQAKEKRLEALKLKQDLKLNPGDTSGDAQRDKLHAQKALSLEEDAKIRREARSFAQEVNIAAKAKDKHGRQLDLLARQEGFDALKAQGEESQYANAAATRGLAGEVASGTRITGSVEAQQAKLVDTRTTLKQLYEELGFIGDEITGWLGESLQVYEDQKKIRKEFQAALAELEPQLEKDPTNPTLVGGVTFYKELLSRAQDAEKAALSTSKTVRQNRNTVRGGIDSANISVAEGEYALPKEATFDSLMAKMKEAWSLYQQIIQTKDVNKILGDGIQGVLLQGTGALSTFFTDVVTGTKKAGNAFRDMAVTMIKAMVDVLAQALAMQAVKGLPGLFGMGGGGAPSVGAPTMFSGGGAPVVAATGGLITGGTPGKDSVPVMAMPGEVIIPKSTVDMVGQDYLLNLGSKTNAVTSRTGGGSMVRPRTPDTTNVWVVAPDAKPTLGPKDVLMVITDDMMRGGATRQLIKQIQTGAA